MADKSTSFNLDLILEDLGGFGRFQIFMYFLASLGSFYSGFFIVLPLFGSKVLSHRCKIPTCEDTTTSYKETFLNFTIPWDEKKNRWSECQMFSEKSSVTSFVNDSSSSTSSILSASSLNSSSCASDFFNPFEQESCGEWVFDTSEFTSSTVSEFKLICDRAWLIPFEMSSIMAGYLVGSLSLGILSDKYGRKMGLIVSALALSISGITASFVPYYSLFIFLRFIGGIGSMGCFQVAFIAAIEYIGPKWRIICCVLLNVPFTVGEAALGLVGYFIRSWRVLSAVTAIPVMIIFSYYWIMSESVRWLLTQNRKQEALEILKKIARANGKTLPSEVETQIKNEDTLENSAVNNGSMYNLLSSPVLRIRSIILFYCWMVCSLVYYGLVSYIGSFSGNMFINFTLIILVEIPGYAVAAFASNVFGRKLILVISYLCGGAACITAGFSSPERESLILAMSLIGKLFVTASFGTIFVYSGEIYPTEYRAVGVGACSMHSRIGGIIAPFIANLTQFYKPLPSLVFGTLTILAGLLIILLPETMGVPLPQTLKDSELIGKGESVLKFGRKEKA